MIQIASRLLSACFLALVAQLPSHSAERTQLVVYSTLEPDFLAELKKAFEADNPDLSILWQKDATGVITVASSPREDNVGTPSGVSPRLQ